MVQLLLIYGLSLWAAPLLLQWVFQGHERMHLVAVAQVIRQTIFAAIVFIFVRSSDQILMVAWAEVAGVTCAALYCVLMYRRHFKTQSRMRPAISARMFREGVPIGLSQMSWVVKMFGGTLILGVIASASETGFFAGAQRILIALHTFVWLYFFNLLPSMSRNWLRDRMEFNRLIERSMKLVVWIGGAVGLVWVMLARNVMRIVYGAEFSSGGPVLALFAGVFVMAVISGHYRFGLIAAGHQNKEMFTSGLGACAALIIIPVGFFRWGLSGAASGLVIAEALIWITSWLYARRLLKLEGSAKLLIRPSVALVLASSVWFLPLTSVLLRASIALLTFCLLALVLDSTLRACLRDLLALRHTGSERRLNKVIAKAPDGLNA